MQGRDGFHAVAFGDSEYGRAQKRIKIMGVQNIYLLRSQEIINLSYFCRTKRRGDGFPHLRQTWRTFYKVGANTKPGLTQRARFVCDDRILATPVLIRIMDDQDSGGNIAFHAEAIGS